MFRSTIALSFALFTGGALAQGAQTHPHSHDHAAPGAAPQINVPVPARDAVATVERFFAALSTGRIEAAGAELDPNVLVLESGGAERSAAEYLGGHARGDAAFLQAAHHQLLRRSAQVSGDMAWVASESELHTQKDGQPVTIVSTETMVLRRSATGWKIVHIHWSSRTQPAAAR